jgi:hypothetical protein
MFIAGTLMGDVIPVPSGLLKARGGSCHGLTMFEPLRELFTTAIEASNSVAYLFSALARPTARRFFQGRSRGKQARSIQHSELTCFPPLL